MFADCFDFTEFHRRGDKTMSHFKAYSANPGGVSTTLPASVILGESETLGTVAVNAKAFEQFESNLQGQLDSLVSQWAAWTTSEGEYAEIRKIVKGRGQSTP
jgi:hypothetical protein